MEILKTLENIMLAIFLTLLCLWAITKIEHRLRPEGVRKMSYSTGALVEV